MPWRRTSSLVRKAEKLNGEDSLRARNRLLLIDRELNRRLKNLQKEEKLSKRQQRNLELIEQNKKDME